MEAAKISRLTALQGKTWAGGDGGAERTDWRIANLFEGINATGWTRRNFPFVVELDVWRQVVGEVDFISSLQAFFLGELICGSSNLTQVIDASVCRTGMRSATVFNRNHNYEADYTNRKN